MEYRVLGPIAIADGSGEVRPGGTKQRVLLAVLLRYAPRTAGTGVLVDALWPDREPVDAASALRTQLSRLRALLARHGAGTDAITSESHGYRLDPRGALDARRFEDLVRRAAALRDPAARLELLDAAQRLWRGEPYEDVAELNAVQGEISRLNELRVAADAQRIDCLLAVGRGDDAVDAAERLVEREPFRERPRALLMQALYAQGRQADALEAFQRYRRLLADELGLDPSPDLRELELRLLRHETGPAVAPRVAAAATGIADAASVPVSAASAPPTVAALPHQLTRLIGRERELAAIDRLLASTRLLTLTGAGGCGKTRLALEVRRSIALAGRATAWIDLDGLSAAGEVAEHVAACLGIRDRPDRSTMDMLLHALRDRDSLLVLDNCEHIIDACASLATQLLQASPSLSILATSREPLAIAGEVAFPVPPLDVPTDEAAAPAELLACAAVQLFVERATSALPSFTLDASTAASVARICRALDGIPLALEFAAARVRTLPLEQIVARLDRRLLLLTGVSRSAPPRQRTLRATIEWSHDLLTPAERSAFAQLSVFAGGFTMESAEAVLDLRDALALDVVTALVDRSLVVIRPDPDEPRAGRYRMLETVREFAWERLEASGEARAVRRRHAAHYAALAEAAEPHLLASGRHEWIGRLVQEQDNLRSALQWTLSDTEAGSVNARLAAALWWFAHARGRIAEARDWIERALRLPGAAADEAVHAKLLYGAAMAAWIGGDLDAASIHAADALRAGRRVGRADALVRALAVSGWIARDAGDYTAALRFADDCAAAARAARAASPAELSPSELGFALWIQGSVHYTAGSLDTARATQEQALAVWRAEGVRWGMSQVLHGLAIIALDEGRLDDAARLCREAIGSLDDEADVYWCCRVLEGLGTVLAHQGHGRHAARLLGAAEALRAPIGAPLLAFEMPRHELAVERLRAILPVDVLEAEWARGRALSRDEAVRHALTPPTAQPADCEDAPASSRASRSDDTPLTRS